MKLDTLEKLFVYELKDLYSAETQLAEALPKMRDAAKDSDLKECFDEHIKETDKHISRLESIFSEMDFEPGGHRCMGMAGLIEEASGLLKADIEPNVLDAAMVAAAQRTEHYEMAGYGTARTYADKLGKREVADKLQLTLDEEGVVNRRLSRLAERKLNFLAMGVVS